MKVYENLTSPTIKRYFVAISANGRITSGILFYKLDDPDEWEIRWRVDVYTEHLKKAREGRDECYKYLGDFDFAGFVKGFVDVIENQQPPQGAKEQ